MLPDSIYLSHQFSFHALTHDWQAPLHRGIFDLPSIKLEVRKEVEASPYPSSSTIRLNRKGDTTESFVQDAAVFGSLFDEPLASAIHARLESKPPLPEVLPSYPNGLQIHPSSWRATGPLIHAAVGLTDGVGEGLGRLKRELGKVAKSPRGGGFRGKRDSLMFNDGDAVVPEEGDESYTALGATGADVDAIVPPPAPPKLGLGVQPQNNREFSTGSESTLSTTNAVSENGANQFDDWRETDVAEDVAEYEAFETFGLGVVGEMDEDNSRGVLQPAIQLPPSQSPSLLTPQVRSLPRVSTTAKPLSSVSPPPSSPVTISRPPPTPSKNNNTPPLHPLAPPASRRRRPGV
jgi:hypothetical protein